MEKLIFVVGALNLVVEYILLMAVDRLSGFSSSRWRKLLCASLAGVYGGLSLTNRYAFLGLIPVRWGFLALAGLFLYWKGGKMLPRLALMLLLNFGIEGFQSLADKDQLFAFAAAGILISFLCVISFRDNASQRYVSVELTYGANRAALTALVDSGNTLHDPISGEPVVIISHKAAYQLTGLTRQQLLNPLDTMEKSGIPGLRLIPYHSVGKENGLLLALRLTGCKIAGKEKDLLVAFAPAGLGKEGLIQALVGGVL